MPTKVSFLSILSISSIPPSKETSGLTVRLPFQTGFSFLAKKAGINISRENQEKITDAGRGAYEKSSGYVDKSSIRPSSLNVSLLTFGSYQQQEGS